MAIFEKDKGEVKEYLAVLDAEGKMIGVFNPSNRKIPLEVFAEAFTAKGLSVEIRESSEVPTVITL
ncbi:MAG: hypothetical protein WC179_06920 [Candidatus Cloacimonadaceae bacterium]|jgi:hypothetical protein